LIGCFITGSAYTAQAQAQVEPCSLLAKVDENAEKRSEAEKDSCFLELSPLGGWRNLQLLDELLQTRIPDPQCESHMQP
jgi:hypothetical protein